MTESLFILEENMNVEFKQSGNKMRVLLKGEIDHHTARKLCETIDFKISVEKPHLVLLDFSNVTFMDSSGLAVVAGRKKLCDRFNIEIYVTNISGHPKKILKMAGADKLIKFLEEQNED